MNRRQYLSSRSFQSGGTLLSLKGLADDQESSGTRQRDGKTPTGVNVAAKQLGTISNCLISCGRHTALD